MQDRTQHFKHLFLFFATNANNLALSLQGLAPDEGMEQKENVMGQDAYKPPAPPAPAAAAPAPSPAPAARPSAKPGARPAPKPSAEEKPDWLE